MNRTKVTINSGRLHLEGVLLTPTPSPGPRSPVAGVVLCHPHPLYGGSMDNNVIYAVSKALVEKGMAALRFNFRGVGRSEGSHDHGRGKVEAARAALAFLAGQEGVDGFRMGLMGYSFGGTVALAAAQKGEGVKAVAAVSPPEIPATSVSIPRLIVCGTRDPLAPTDRILAENERSGGGTVEIVKGADHFWGGYEEEMAGLVSAFFARHLL